VRVRLQGRVRNKVVKRSARQIVEKYYQRLTMDFQTNKRICEDVAIIPSKRLKNKIAGYATVRAQPPALGERSRA
jgi:small subunit ribosomal protein S17e